MFFTPGTLVAALNIPPANMILGGDKSLFIAPVYFLNHLQHISQVSVLELSQEILHETNQTYIISHLQDSRPAQQVRGKLVLHPLVQDLPLQPLHASGFAQQVRGPAVLHQLWTRAHNVPSCLLSPLP